MQTVALRPKHDRRVRSGHPWVFSNELDADVGALPAGAAVRVTDAKGAFLGSGVANPASLIAVRILTRNPADDLDSVAFFSERLEAAVARRRAVWPERRSCRLVHGEGDDLSGLVVDRFGDHLVVQIGSVGIEQRRDLLRAAIAHVLHPAGVVVRSEGPARRLEGLPEERGVWWGDVPERIVVEEHGLRFAVPLLDGQKTGHFHDQADNRLAAGALCRDLDVLDVFANSGGFGLQALRHGARSCLFVDRSAACEASIHENAALNGVADRVRVTVGDGRETLLALRRDGRRFGAVMLDPPAFAKSRKAAGAALKGYEELHAAGAALVAPGGWLVSSSCSFHVEEDRFTDAVVAGARRAGRRLSLVRRGEQGADHVIRWEIPETRYLKHAVWRVE